MLLPVFFLVLSVFITWGHARETGNYIMRKIENDSCPIIGYFMERLSSKNDRDGSKNALQGDSCYLCFCHSEDTAICWPRENKRCDGVALGDNSSLKRPKRSPFGLKDIFFRDTVRDVLGVQTPEECKPFEDSRSEGCPPDDWCIGCTVCDCDANGRWKCHPLSFCPEEKKPEKKKPPEKRRKYISWRQRQKTIQNQSSPSTTTVTSKPEKKLSRKSISNRATRALNTNKTNKPVNVKISNQKPMNTKLKPSATKNLNTRTTKIKSNTTRVKPSNYKNGPTKTAIKRTVLKTSNKQKTTPNQKKTQVDKLQTKRAPKKVFVSNNKQSTKRFTNSVKATTINYKIQTTIPRLARLTNNKTNELQKHFSKRMILMKTTDNKAIKNQTQSKFSKNTKALRTTQSQPVTHPTTKERHKTKARSKVVTKSKPRPVIVTTEKKIPPFTPKPQINDDEEEPAFDSHEYMFRKKRHIVQNESFISEIATEGPGEHTVLEENMIESNVTKTDSNFNQYTIPENYYKYSTNNNSKLKTGNDINMEDKKYLNDTDDIEIRDHGIIMTTEPTLGIIKIKKSTDIMDSKSLNNYSVRYLPQTVFTISPIKIAQNIISNYNEIAVLNTTESITGSENTANLSIGQSTQDKMRDVSHDSNINKSRIDNPDTIISPLSKSYKINTVSTFTKKNDDSKIISSYDSNDKNKGENKYKTFANTTFTMEENQKEVIKNLIPNSRLNNENPYQINTISTLMHMEATTSASPDFDSDNNKTGEIVNKYTNKPLITKKDQKEVIKNHVPNTRFNYPIRKSKESKAYQLYTVSDLMKMIDTSTTIPNFDGNKNISKENLYKNMDKNFRMQEDQKEVTSNDSRQNLKFMYPFTITSPISKSHMLNTISTSMKIANTPTTISDIYSSDNYMRENLYENIDKTLTLKNQLNDDLKTKKQHLIRLIKIKVPDYDVNKKYIDELTKHQKRSTQLIQTTESMQDNNSNKELEEPLQSSHKYGTQNIFIPKVVKLNNFKSVHSHNLHKYPPEFGQKHGNYENENGYKHLFVSKSMKDNFHELQNLINILIHKGTNNTLNVDNFNVTNETPMKYLKTLFTKKLKNQRKLRTFKEHSFEGHQMLKLTKFGFNKMICKSGIGPCSVAIRKEQLMNNTIDDMKNETKNILYTVGVIKRLLNTLRLKYNTKEDVKEENQSTELDETKIIKDILNEKGSDTTDTTQLIQKQYLKENSEVLVKSVKKFAALLENLVSVIDRNNSNSNNLIRIIRHARKKHKYHPNPNARNTLKNLKQLLRNYNLVQNTFINKMYEAIESFERNEQNNLITNTKIKSFSINLNNTFEVEQYTKKIIRTLRKIKELAQRLQTKAGNTRVKRNVKKNADVTDYMFLLMEYLLKKPLDSRTANDGIDLLIETIRGAPDIRAVRKKVLENSKRLDTLRTTKKSFKDVYDYKSRKDLERPYFSTTVKIFNYKNERNASKNLKDLTRRYLSNDEDNNLKDSIKNEHYLLTTNSQNHNLSYDKDMSLAMDESYFNGKSLRASKENKNTIYESSEEDEESEEYFQSYASFPQMEATDSNKMSDSNQLSVIENNLQNVNAVSKIGSFRDEESISVTNEYFENIEAETEFPIHAPKTFIGDEKVSDGDDKQFENLIGEIEELPSNSTLYKTTTEITTIQELTTKVPINFVPDESDGKKLLKKSTNLSNSDSSSSDSVDESKPKLAWIDESVDSNSLEFETNGTLREETRSTEKCEEHNVSTTTATSISTVIIPYTAPQESSQSSEESGSGEITMKKKSKLNATEILKRKNANLMNYLDYGLDKREHDDSESKGHFNDDKDGFQNDF